MGKKIDQSTDAGGSSTEASGAGDGQAGTCTIRNVLGSEPSEEEAEAEVRREKAHRG